MIQTERSTHSSLFRKETNNCKKKILTFLNKKSKNHFVGNNDVTMKKRAIKQENWWAESRSNATGLTLSEGQRAVDNLYTEELLVRLTCDTNVECSLFHWRTLEHRLLILSTLPSIEVSVSVRQVTVDVTVPRCGQSSQYGMIAYMRWECGVV